MGEGMLLYTVASQHLKEITIEGLNYVRIKFIKKKRMHLDTPATTVCGDLKLLFLNDELWN